jgi:hypothetical protein
MSGEMDSLGRVLGDIVEINNSGSLAVASTIVEIG